MSLYSWFWNFYWLFTQGHYGACALFRGGNKFQNFPQKYFISNEVRILAFGCYRRLLLLLEIVFLPHHWETPCFDSCVNCVSTKWNINSGYDAVVVCELSEIIHLYRLLSDKLNGKQIHRDNKKNWFATLSLWSTSNCLKNNRNCALIAKNCHCRIIVCTSCFSAQWKFCPGQTDGSRIRFAMFPITRFQSKLRWRLQKNDVTISCHVQCLVFVFSFEKQFYRFLGLAHTGIPTATMLFEIWPPVLVWGGCLKIWKAVINLWHALWNGKNWKSMSVQVTIAGYKQANNHCYGTNTIIIDNPQSVLDLNYCWKFRDAKEINPQKGGTTRKLLYNTQPQTCKIYASML